MGILSWILFGLLAGFVAKWLMPGTDPGGIIITIILGVLGAVVGGYLASLLGWGSVTDFDIRSFLIAVGGGVLLLFVYRLLQKKR
jgi:uncharacterized membrane protein YeaQ/YmgE (transglycosylase-associated protein family)